MARAEGEGRGRARAERAMAAAAAPAAMGGEATAMAATIITTTITTHHLPPPSLAAAAAAPRALCERAVCACVCGMVCGGSAWHRAARRLGARCCSRGSRVRSGCSGGRCAQEGGLRGSVGAIRTFSAHERLFCTNVGTWSWSVVKDVRVRVSYVCMCNRFRPIKKCFSSTLHL